MANIGLKLGLKLSQQLVMTPQLQQAIKLLQLNRMELAELVNNELVENPVLEEGPEQVDSQGESIETPSDASDPEAQQKRDEEAYNQNQDQKEDLSQKDDFDWQSYLEEYNSYSSTAPSMKEVNEELPSFENTVTKTSTLEDHLKWQLSMAALADDEVRFGDLVIGNLSDDGYLKAKVEDLAGEAGLDVEDAEEVLKILQRFDPIGVCSRNLQECLLVQVENFEKRDPQLEKLLKEHMSDLERKNYGAISKALNLPLEKVHDYVRVILELEPKPGRSFQSSETHYITPDIYVYKVNNEFVIVLNEDGMPKLRISPYYRNILANMGKGENKVTKEYVQEKLRSALWLIRSIHNRQKTIYKVTEAIVNRQKDFFVKGVQFLKPMILKDVANDIGMHESTISRVTTNKYVHTPVGIFELKYFFNSSINTADGHQTLASEAVKEKIRQMVGKEDPKHPLSDQKIVELLKGDNINIARRTVAKYREMLGILSSGKRKKVI